MKPITLPTFDVLEKTFSKTGLELNPAQVQGIICGILCGNTPPPGAWQDLIADGTATAKVHELLQTIFQSSMKQLEEFAFEFQLLLPSENKPLPLRAEALTLWCQGFLTGLKFAHIPTEGREPSEVTEAINDLIEIAKMNYEEVVSSEEDEVAYVELVEYVRVAVILIFQDLSELRNKSPKAMSSHPLH